VEVKWSYKDGCRVTKAIAGSGFILGQKNDLLQNLEVMCACHTKKLPQKCSLRNLHHDPPSDCRHNGKFEEGDTISLLKNKQEWYALRKDKLVADEYKNYMKKQNTNDRSVQVFLKFCAAVLKVNNDQTALKERGLDTALQLTEDLLLLGEYLGCVKRQNSTIEAWWSDLSKAKQIAGMNVSVSVSAGDIPMLIVQHQSCVSILGRYRVVSDSKGKDRLQLQMEYLDAVKVLMLRRKHTYAV